MNSSGIKRGLATTAVSALAVSGIPFIASSASAAVGDAITIVSVGPVRNSAGPGLEIQATLKGVTAGSVKIADKALGSDIQPDTLTQDIGTLSLGDPIPSGSDRDSNKTDGLAEQIFIVSAVTTAADGGTFEFALFEDEANPDVVDDTEARAQVTGITSGAPVAVEASPSLQNAAKDVDSGDFTLTLRDNAGRISQLSGSEEIRLAKASGPGTVSFDPEGTVTSPISATEVGRDGKVAFVASANAEGLHVIRAGVYANANTDPAVTPESFGTNVNLNVSGSSADAQSIAPTEFNLVTGADNRDGYDKTSTSANVRQDQNAVTVEIKDVSQANKIITLTATSAAAPNAVTFGGKTFQTQTTTLNAQGVGSVTFTADAASIQTGDSFTIDGPALFNAAAPAGFPAEGFTVNYNGASLATSSVDADQTVYISGFGGTVTPVVTVKDQFGNPVTNAFVSYEITSGPNDTNTESARVKTNDQGQVTFSITDTKATATNQADGGLTFRVYANEFDASSVIQDTGSRIDYSATGQGADFLVSVDNQVPGGTVYNPAINPLTDTVATNGYANIAPNTTDGSANANTEDSRDEFAEVRIAGGTPGVAATVSVDGGALVLLPGETQLSQGSASATGTVADTFRIIGTEAGTVNITVTSGGKTQTATLAVRTLSQSTSTAANDNGADDLAQAPQTARNIAVSGPDGAVSGDVVSFVVTITDAFGNPVRGFSPNNISTQLLGPADLEGNSGASNAAGEITYTVELDQDAARDISFQVTATGADFGAAANRLTAASTTNDGTGLSASVNVANAEVSVENLDDLEAAVERAEAELAAAQAALTNAQGDLDVALAEVAVQQAEVDRLKERKAELRQKLNKAKAADNRKKAKTTRKKLRNVKQQLNDAKDALAVAQTAADAAQDDVEAAQVVVTEAEEALAQAEQDLEDAQN